MKKLIALILALVMVVCCFAACGAKNGTDADVTSDAAGNESENAEKLIMATNAAFPPYEYLADDGSFAGIDVEIAGKIAEKLGMELEIVDTEFGSIIGGVQSGKYSMGMAGMTVNEERLQSVNFSDPYAKGIQAVIVKADSEYASYEDFYTGYDDEGNPAGVKDGIKIGVQADTTGDIYSSDKPEKWGFGEDNVIRYKTGNDAVQALVAGKVTAVIIDNEPAKSYVAANDGLKILDGAYTDEDYAICVAKENTDLLDKINKALAELTEDGTVAEIVEKYIPADK
ncbi:MAG: transporter substrate-binding domain-containing protein [Clostridia bacterium]|nr:transporter substrate-binding domain-containing protein [Clostridia bacterium]